MASKKKLKLVEKQAEGSSKVAEFNQKEREHVEPAEWQLFMELKQEAEAAAAIMNVQQKRLVKKYNLGQFDGVDMYGNIARGVNATQVATNMVAEEGVPEGTKGAQSAE